MIEEELTSAIKERNRGYKIYSKINDWTPQKATRRNK